MDREKVIKGIQECDLNGGLIGNCPYKGIIAMLKEQEQMYYTLEHDWRMCRELLKEQEAVKPKKIKGFNQPCYVHYDFVCENCNTDLIYKQPYCAGCGRQVKWE